jgi:hypothetical protein
MTQIIKWLLIAVLLIPASSRAEQPVDGPQAKFNDPFIENLVGDWELARSIRGKTIRNKVKAEWVLNHQFLQIHMTDVAVPPEYEAIVMVGYSHADHEYIAHWCDVFGGKYSAMGRGKLVGDSIEFAFQFDDGPFFNTFSWNAKDQGWTFDMQGTDAKGKKIPFATDVLRRTPGNS